MHLPSLSLLLGSASLALTSALGAQTIVIGSFDSDLSGWSVSGFTTDDTRSIALDNGMLAYTPGTNAGGTNGNHPFQWAIQYDANFLGGNLDTISAAPSVLLSFDVMLDWSEWSTTGDAWVQFAEVVYNSPATDFSPLSRGDAVTQDLLTDTGNPGFPGGTDIATGTYTTTLTWDITNLISGAVAGDDYNQLAIAVNYSGDITPGNFYFDNVALTAVPEPSALGLLMGLGAIGFALRRRR